MTILTTKNKFNIADERYQNFLNETKQKIVTTRIQAAKAVCKEQINLYWWLGQQIVEAQVTYGWGKSVVEQLSKDLKYSFNSSFGFSVQNLWYMRQFYLEYEKHPNLQRLVGEIPWGQNLEILSKVKDNCAKEYYINAVLKLGWTRAILTLQINSKAYERHVLAKKQHNFEKALPEHLAEQADKALKDIYMLDTLGLTKPVVEKEMEARMINKIKNVMLELGYGFTFMGNQYRIAHAGSDYFIDLLFYNRKLKSLIPIEIKTGKFIPEYAGKMNFYLNLLDDYVREPDENPSIGIILCSERNHFDVEYALRGINNPIGISEFCLTRDLPRELNNKLPNAKELEREIFSKLD
jgi:predicted nuclease of restriction endonuclease-like (RecB) superfamily